MANILVLQGPNLNLLGNREPQHYGTMTLATIQKRLDELAASQGHNLIHRQTNAEHLLIEYTQQALNEEVAFIIINPAAFTHTSIALRDTLAAVAIPFIEVHISNIYARESWRHHSYTRELAIGVITGLGAYGYSLALLAANNYLQSRGVL